MYQSMRLYHLGAEVAMAMPMFHAFTGCDTTSVFAGRGKTSAWNAWETYPQVTGAFNELARCPLDISMECKLVLERFVVLLYDKTSEHNEINKARRELFAHKGRELENIPPTKGALEQHIRRATYQGGFIWGQVLNPNPDLPSPGNWGWQRCGQSWEPPWTTLPEASKICR